MELKMQPTIHSERKAVGCIFSSVGLIILVNHLEFLTEFWVFTGMYRRLPLSEIISKYHFDR
jgi:hypothetical protein